MNSSPRSRRGDAWRGWEAPVGHRHSIKYPATAVHTMATARDMRIHRVKLPVELRQVHAGWVGLDVLFPRLWLPRDPRTSFVRCFRFCLRGLVGCTVSFAVSGAPPGLEALAGIFAPAMMASAATPPPGKAPTASPRSWCILTTPGRAFERPWWAGGGVVPAITNTSCLAVSRSRINRGLQQFNQGWKRPSKGPLNTFFPGEFSKEHTCWKSPRGRFTKIRTQGVTLEAKTTPRGSQHHADD